MSLGKITASIASDGSSSRIQTLGTALSSHRRHVTEDGDIHSTARKLRAIFEQILPATPTLYKAYGKRASEIAGGPQVNSQDTAASGAFEEHLGVDGGSIWAAATSGPGAIAIHLLACMLAKLWSAPEATSIWEEIVSLRKQQLSTADGNDPQSLFAAWASKCTLSRHQLADWDSSARAWLRTADEKHRVKQKQLKLIVDNVDLPVNNKTNVYDSVITAWISAMVALNKLIEGMPHKNSAILLALSAWHLFPNMSVLSTENHFVQQNDPLIDSRGILTLGLQSAASMHQRRSLDDIGKGITWSLPLAYYRFYGDPVEKEKALNTDGSRISITQLLQVSLGCVFADFKQRHFSAFDAAQLMLDIGHCVSTQGSTDNDQWQSPWLSEQSWLAILSEAAREYIKSQGVDRSEYTRLFNYSRRRCPQFLGLDQRSVSLISKLRQPNVLLKLVNSYDARIILLRRVVLRLGCDPSEMIIRYALPKTNDHDVVTYELATVVPIQIPNSVSTHMRWRIKRTVDDQLSSNKMHIERTRLEPMEEGTILGPLEDGKKTSWSEAPLHYSEKGSIMTEVDAFFGDFAELALFRGKVTRGRSRTLEGVPFEFLFGDPHIAAIYRIPRAEDATLDLFELDDIRAAVTNYWGLIPQSALLKHLGEVRTKTTSCLGKHIRSLKTLATICKVYKNLAGATVAMSLTTRELHSSKWMPDTDLKEAFREMVPSILAAETSRVQLVQAFEPLDLDPASTFACIAMHESGTIDLSAAGMSSVMAMSSGDSLFVANLLLSDPSHHPESNIRRIRGNIGRAGIAMMVPPEQLRTRKPEVQDWNYLNYDEFDGLLIDSFKATSLHMSFTNFVLPIDTGVRGLRDTEIYFLETVISVHDQGQWMGDLDIMPIHKSPLLRPLCQSESCTHHLSDIKQVDPEFTSIDSWREFFDRPADISVFRARGNWMARLAATTISVYQGHLTLVFGDRICWKCGVEERERLSHKPKPILII